MKRLLPLLALIVLSPLLLFAQTTFQPGLIVNLQGDTIHGSIGYSNWQINPDHILFKANGSGEMQKISAGEIEFFSVSIDHLAKFVAYDGPVSTDATKINQLSVGRDSSYSTRKVFLKVLQEGKNLILFSYSDNPKTRFFMASNYKEKPVELVFRIYYNSIDDNGRDRTSYENTFKSQIYQRAVDAGVMNPALKKQIKAADYKEADLLHVAALINGISETDQAKNNPEKPRGINKLYAIFGGIAVIVFFIIDLGRIHSR